ncbi:MULTISPECIES: acyl-CoA dehydrogenase family protein [unclassified Micromonospora]|uniref:acyl-CoA dehydrogenase family protein n=1 Tax=unclassified Micromonospora TaxID=2617518 RepID=UPI002FF36A6B
MHIAVPLDPVHLLASPAHQQVWTDAVAFARDKFGAAPAGDDSGFSRTGWERCAEFGLTGFPVPREHGGHAADLLASTVAFDAFGYACRESGLLFSIGAHLWPCVMSILRFGTAAQRHRYLPDMCAGRLIGAYAMTEPATGSDAFALTTTAARVDGGWLVNGSKTFITNAPVAGLFLVFATTGRERGPFGLVCLLVEATTPGVATGAPLNKMGLHGSPVGEVHFTDCFVPDAATLGRVGMGMAIFNAGIELERACILASTLGTMQRQIERAARQLRRAEGGGPPPGLELAADTVARMTMRLHTSRLLAYRTAERLGHQRLNATDAALVKVKLSEAFAQNSRDARQLEAALRGGVSPETDRDVHDAVAGRIYSGTNELQRDALARGLGL